MNCPGVLGAWGAFEVSSQQVRAAVVTSLLTLALFCYSVQVSSVIWLCLQCSLSLASSSPPQTLSGRPAPCRPHTDPFIFACHTAPLRWLLSLPLRSLTFPCRHFTFTHVCVSQDLQTLQMSGTPPPPPCTLHTPNTVSLLGNGDHSLSPSCQKAHLLFILWIFITS